MRMQNYFYCNKDREIGGLNTIGTHKSRVFKDFRTKIFWKEYFRTIISQRRDYNLLPDKR